VNLVKRAVALAKTRPDRVVSAGQVAYADCANKTDATWKANYVADVLVESGKFTRITNNGAIGKRIALLKLKESCK
jgi:predicted chitinase